METMKKYRLIYNNPPGEYPYNVQEWTSTDGGTNYYYTGNGRFFKHLGEAQAYKAEQVKAEDDRTGRRTVYNREEWTDDRSFSAYPGQEITEDIYNQMYNCMSPLYLPQETAQKAMDEYGVPVHAGFLMGEPHESSEEGQLYLAFGMNDYGKGKHYYFLGLSLRAKKLRNGQYYEFECMNAFVEGKLFPAHEWTEAEAIAKAADYEATLYLHTIKNGEIVETRTLYNPWDIYGKGEGVEE